MKPTSLAENAPTELLVGGEWRAGQDSARIPVADPATGQVIAEVASASKGDAEEAVGAAAAALPGWAATAPRQRAEVLRRAFDLVRSRADELARLIVLENGKPLADARAEVTYAAEFLRWFSEEAVRLDGQLGVAPNGGMRMMVLRQPIGVALLITPWNLPLAMIARKVAPALAAGCTTIAKPASATPLCALELARLLAEAGLPDGALNVLPTRRTGEVVGALLAAEPVRKLSFTGSTEVGRMLLAQASERVVNCSMELGGNAPLIVFDDADLDLAVEATIVAKMRHNAEACTAANRLIVHEALLKRFSHELGAAMGQLRVGPGLEPQTQVGPLIDGQARERVAELVDAAVDAGAQVVTGGTAPSGNGWFYEPTVLEGIEPGASILGEEIFGPVAPIVSFGSEDELVELANATEHGLMSYVFSRDLGRALRTAEALHSGMVAINRGVISDPAAPFGGVKQSGLGREGGHEGILEYTEAKYIGVDW